MMEIKEAQEAKFIFEDGNKWILKRTDTYPTALYDHYFFGEGKKPTNPKAYHLDNFASVFIDYDLKNEYDDEGYIKRTSFLVVIDDDLYSAGYIYSFLHGDISFGYAHPSQQDFHLNFRGDLFRKIEIIEMKDFMLSLISFKLNMDKERIKLYGDFPLPPPQISDQSIDQSIEKNSNLNIQIFNLATNIITLIMLIFIASNIVMK